MGGGSKKRKLSEDSETDESDTEWEHDSEIEDDVKDNTCVSPDDVIKKDEQPDVSIYIKDVDTDLTLESMGGLHEIKKDLYATIIFPFVEKELNRNHPAPKGLLLHGAPGTGKTQIALRIVSEINRNLKGEKITFYQLEGNETFYLFPHAGDIKSKYFGESEKILKSLFTSAVQNKPSIIFLDEIDALACSRDTLEEACAGVASSILVQFNSFEQGEVMVIGTTNMASKIDPALLRPGRISKKIQFLPPTEEGRAEIISRMVANWGKNIPSQHLIKKLAKLSPGFTGADLHDLCFNTMDAARIRTIGDRNQGKEIVKVLRKGVNVADDDWMMTLETIKPTNVNCYGGYNFQFSGVDTNTRLLMEDSKNKILQMLAEKEIKSLLVWTENPIDDLNNYIVPFALESVMAEYDIFDAETTKVVNNEKTPYLMFIEASDAALASRKKSILVIMQIDEYWYELSERQKDRVSVKLRELRNKNVKLFATSNTPIKCFRCSKLEKLFPPIWCTEIEKISNETITNYFENILDKAVEKLIKLDRQNNKRRREIEFQNLLKPEFERLPDITEDFSIDQLSNLYEALSKTITDSNCQNSEELTKEIKIRLDTLENK